MSKFKFSKSSLSRLEDVHPLLQKLTHRALELSEYDFGVIAGARSLEDQKKAIANGTSWIKDPKNGKHVAKLYPGVSKPVSIAVDILPSVIKPGDDWNKFIPQFEGVLSAYDKASKELGITIRFGKNWSTDLSAPASKKADYPHVELVL